MAKHKQLSNIVRGGGEVHGFPHDLVQLGGNKVITHKFIVLFWF